MPVSPSTVGDDREVAMWASGVEMQPHAAVQAGVVEEVVVVALAAWAPSARTLTTPGGIDCHVSSLFTTTVIRCSWPGRADAVTSASKGV